MSPAFHVGMSEVSLPTTTYPNSSPTGAPPSRYVSNNAKGRPNRGFTPSTGRTMKNCPGTIRDAISGVSSRRQYVSRAMRLCDATRTICCTSARIEGPGLGVAEADAQFGSLMAASAPSARAVFSPLWRRSDFFRSLRPSGSRFRGCLGSGFTLRPAATRPSRKFAHRLQLGAGQHGESGLRPTC